MTIVRALVRQIGGELTIAADGGRGARFTVTFSSEAAANLNA